MSCTECVSVRDILDSLWIKDFTCKKKIFKMQRALREFYALTYDISDNRMYEPFTTGLNEIETQYDIYHIRGFFWKSSDCNTSCFMELNKTCKCSDCLWANTKQIKMHKGTYTLDNFQYQQTCGNTIKTRVDCWMDSWHFKYSRWAEKITNQIDTICMSQRMLTLFYTYLDYFYAKDDTEYNRMGIFDKKFQDMLKLTKELDTWHIIFIGK